MGLDARVRYTKMVIDRSFCELLAEKPFHRLTLTEVCRRAEINRSTFYKYYQDIYAWKEQLEQRLLHGVEALLNEAPTDRLEDALAQGLSKMREQKELYMLIVSPNFESGVLETVMELILQKAGAEVDKFLAARIPDAHTRAWYGHFIAYGCAGIVQCWMKDGMEQEPEEVAAYYAQRIRKCFTDP